MKGWFIARVLSLLVLLPLAAQAQSHVTEATILHQQRTLERLRSLAPSLKASWDVARGTIHLNGILSPPATIEPEAQARNFLTENNIPFIMPNSDVQLKFEETTTDRLGGNHVRFTQIYRGVPVWAKAIKVHVNSAGEVAGVNGRYMPANVDLSVETSVSDSQALSAALRHAGNTAETMPVSGPTLVIFERQGNFFLTWTITLRGSTDSDEEALWVYFVDANTEDIIFRFNNLQTQAATGFGLDCKNNSLNLNIFLDSEESSFLLRDTSRVGEDGGEILTLDGNSRISADDDGNWNDTTTSPRSASQQPEGSTHFWLGRSYNLLRELTDRESFDNAGSNVIARTHVTISGSTNNASWNGIERKFSFADGDGQDFTYFGCANDVVAHEFMHAVTQFTASLVYSDESGALNEAYSDIFGAMIDSDDWLVGEDLDIPPLVNDGGIRDMQDPTRRGQPDHYDDRFTGSDDNGGVHINSGIINKAFYLLAEGFAIETGSGYACNVSIGRSEAWPIFYRSLANYLTADSEFPDLRNSAIASAGDLYPDREFYAVLVDNVFAKVGVGELEEPLVCPEPSLWLLF